VEPGSDVRFMVSAESPTFYASLVRLFHGDLNGPGLKFDDVEGELAGTYPGKVQELRVGSYVLIPSNGHLELQSSFSIHMWIRPTTPDKETQTLISRASAGGSGFALRLERGRLTLQVGPDAVTLDTPVALYTWYSVAAVYDAESRRAELSLRPLAATAGELAAATERPLAAVPGKADADLTIAAEAVGNGVGNFYNGKIDAPRLFARALADDDVEACHRGEASRVDAPIAAWDFSVNISSSVITDVSGSGLHGRAVNKPMRGATGHNWDGSETAWPNAPEQYGAIHFHDDDLDDAGWEPSLRWTVPDEMASGVYAVRLRAGGDEDFIPFVVCPRRGRPTARIALVMPTFSHLAYANEHMVESGRELMERLGATGEAASSYPSEPADRYIVENRLNSLYDSHTDGSGVCYASKLRPLVTMRPRYTMPALNKGEGSAHQFNADLHLVDWLHESRYTVDVLTDEDLHLEGVGLLESYSCVLTGTHHEYWSIEMIDAVQQYLHDGGRLMYLAANGMYWVTQYDPETGNGIEIRRSGPSTRTWEPEPGEAHLSATGELGGIWRFRGRSPQSWLGIGFTAQGFDHGRPYHRQPDSFGERAAWVFEGIGDDELIGDFPCLVNGYGAAGFEIDRADHALGTPHRTLLLATASGFSDLYQHVSEEVLVANSLQGGTVNPLVRADMTLLEYPNGGAVFTPGSISWCGCLSYNGYDNNVSRVTRNVLNRFLADGRAAIHESGGR
jgi:N,N-dimethylformamidase